MTIGTELKAIMKKKGITGYRISKETGIDEAHINRILHNRHYPNTRTLERILDVLGYEIRFVKSKKKGGESFR